MSRFDRARNLLRARVVYWGPRGSGKTQCLATLLRFLDPEEQTRLYSVADADGSTLSFDLLPVEEFRLGSQRVRLRVLAVPGHPERAAARRALVREADAVVFVADSRAEAADRNRASLGELEAALQAEGRAGIPVVYSFNRHDDPTARSVAGMREELALPKGAGFEASATDGRGVFEAFAEVFRQVLEGLVAEHSVVGAAREGLTPTLILPQLARGATPRRLKGRGATRHVQLDIDAGDGDALAALGAQLGLVEEHVAADARSIKLDERNRELMAINRVARSILSAMDAENLLVVLLDSTAEHLGIAYGTCVLFDPTEQGTLRTHVLGFGRDPALRLTDAAARHFFDRLQQSDGPVPGDDQRNPELLASLQKVDRRVMRALFQPIKNDRGRLLGWLGIYATGSEPPLSTQELLFLSSISRLAALGLDQIVEMDKLRRASGRLEEVVKERTGQLEMANARVRALNRGLESRVAERTRALEDANRKLREARAGAVSAARTRGMGELAASFVHEVAEPVESLAAHLQAMQEGLDELAARVAPAVAEDSAALDAIHDWEIRLEETLQGTGRMEGVLRSLRRFGDVAQPGRPEGRVSLNAVVADAVTLIEERVKGTAELDLQLGTLPEVEGNALELVHVALALLTNAVEALERRGRHGRLTVTTFHSGEKITLVVRDDGAGIEPSILKSVLDPFVTTKEVQGAGLGLHTATKAVRRHGGTIKVRSKPDEGTSVTVVLPVAPEPPPPGGAPPDRPYGAGLKAAE